MWQWRVYLQPAFLICVAVLATSELVIKPLLGVVIPDKEPLPLKKPLDLLDEEDLSPYKVISKTKIENKQMVKELGTQDYIQWVLQDCSVAADSAVRKLLLFITYYELPDRVVHVPEECYTGGGYQRLTSDSITFEISSSLDARCQIPERESGIGNRVSSIKYRVRGKYLVFGGTKSNFWQSKANFPVLYFFRVDGKYVGSREETRITLNKNIFGKFSYFSKVELAFNQNPVMPDKEKALTAGEKLLGVILPILEAKHWPDWKKEDSGE